MMRRVVTAALAVAASAPFAAAANIARQAAPVVTVTTSMVATRFIEVATTTTIVSTSFDDTTVFTTATATSSNAETATSTIFVTSTALVARGLDHGRLAPRQSTLVSGRPPTTDPTQPSASTVTVTIAVDKVATTTSTRIFYDLKVQTREVTSTITSVTYVNAKTTVTTTSTIVVSSRTASGPKTIVTVVGDTSVTLTAGAVSTPTNTSGGSGGGSNGGSGDGGGDGLSTGAKIGIGVGAGVAVLAILGAVLYYYKVYVPKANAKAAVAGWGLDASDVGRPPMEAYDAGRGPTIPDVGHPSDGGQAGFAKNAGVGGGGAGGGMGAAEGYGGIAAGAAAGALAGNRASHMSKQSRVSELSGEGGGQRGTKEFPAEVAGVTGGHHSRNTSELGSAGAPGAGAGGPRQYAHEADSRPVMSHSAGPVRDVYEMP